MHCTFQFCQRVRLDCGRLQIRSAFLDRLFAETTRFYGIYRDDGIVFFDGNWSTDDITRWIKTFQLRVDDLVGSSELKFTAEIWRPTKSKIPTVTKLSEQINVIEGKYFPFLDIALFWNDHGDLDFITSSIRSLTMLNWAVGRREDENTCNTCFAS